MRIGLLGAARITPHVIIAPAQRSRCADVVAVASRDEKQARAFAKCHHIPGVEPSYEALLARDDLDLVYIALPNASHAHWSIRASERGHAVLCEKPFATRLVDAQKMVAAGDVVNRPVIEAFHYRHHPLMHALVEMVGAGAIGRVLHAEAEFVANLPRADAVRWSAPLGGGALFDLGCYAVHALRTVFGNEPMVRSARAEFIDEVDAWLEGDLVFENCPHASIRCSMVADHRAANLQLRGERGVISVTNFIAPQLPHSVVIQDARGEHRFSFDGPGTFDHQLRHVKAVVAGDEFALTGGSDAIANMSVIEDLYKMAGRPGCYAR